MDYTCKMHSDTLSMHLELKNKKQKTIEQPYWKKLGIILL